MSSATIDLSLFCGILGAGKTTVIDSILSASHAQQVANEEQQAAAACGGADNSSHQTPTPRKKEQLCLLIINDYHTTNIDAFAFSPAALTSELAEQHLSQQQRLEEQVKRVASGGSSSHRQPLHETAVGGGRSKMSNVVVVELSGGCICCNLLSALTRLLEAAVAFNHKSSSSDAEYVTCFLECTGVAESVPIIGTLLHLKSLRGAVQVRNVINVIDVRQLLAVIPLPPPQLHLPSGNLVARDDEHHDPHPKIPKSVSVAEAEELLAPFFALYQGLPRETLCGADVLLLNAWEDAFQAAAARYQQQQQQQAGAGSPTPLVSIHRALHHHLSTLGDALRLVAVNSLLPYKQQSEDAAAAAGGGDDDDGVRSSSAPSVRVCITQKGQFGPYFLANLSSSPHFFLEGSPFFQYFTQALGEERRAAVERSDVFLTGDLEEAKERERLGLHTWLLNLKPSSSSPSVLKLSQLQSALRSARGRELFRPVWRSKGYFVAIDDEANDDGSLPSSSSSAAPAAVGGGSTPHHHDEATCKKFFRFQSVGKYIHYGEVVASSSMDEFLKNRAGLIVFLGSFDEKAETSGWSAAMEQLFTDGDPSSSLLHGSDEEEEEGGDI